MSLRWPRVALVAVVLVAAFLDSAATTAASPSPPPETVASTAHTSVRIDNPALRGDSSGAPLDAHDGEVVQFGDDYYWYGTSYGCDFAPNDPTGTFCGFRVYRSSDLARWEDEGLLFDPQTPQWQDECARGNPGCFRPQVVYNPSTGQYVLWVNSAHSTAGYHVFTSPDPTGPFREAATPRLAVRDRPADSTGPYGDESLFVDPATGTGYISYTVLGPDDRHDVAIEALDPTFTTGTGKVTRVGLDFVEAPSLLTYDGRWFLLYADPACPYCGGGTGYAEAPGPFGPWTVLGTLSADSCGGQFAGVSRLERPGGPVYLYQSDRWITGAGNQALAGNYLGPLHFDADGQPSAIRCPDAWSIP